MAFAPQLPGDPTPETPADSSPDLELLRLCNLLGIGVVRVDAEGRAWPQNEAGGSLLQISGGSAGGAAPDPLPELLRAAAAGGPQL
ncbi:MAG TPA: hypothetical protein VIB47_07445, partial [Dehalococcoidia bacterium]